MHFAVTIRLCYAYILFLCHPPPLSFLPPPLTICHNLEVRSFRLCVESSLKDFFIEATENDEATLPLYVLTDSICGIVHRYLIGTSKILTDRPWHSAGSGTSLVTVVYVCMYKS